VRQKGAEDIIRIGIRGPVLENFIIYLNVYPDKSCIAVEKWSGNIRRFIPKN